MELRQDRFEYQKSQFATLNSINFRKSKTDYFSSMGIVGVIATVYYLLFDRDKYLTNMEDPINLTLWILIVLYPLIRYFIPFHIYKLNSTGITLKKGEYLKWSEIKSLHIHDNYEEVKDDDTPVLKLEINIVTLDDKKRKINFSNYTIDNPELKAKLKPLFNKDFKMKDALVRIFETFYEKHKTH